MQDREDTAKQTSWVTHETPTPVVYTAELVFFINVPDSSATSLIYWQVVTTTG